MRIGRGTFGAVAMAALLFALHAAEASADDQIGGKFKLIRNVTYVERGDLPLKADVYMPEGAGPFPGLLVVHYGAWEAGNKARMSTLSERLAEHGYTTVSINYRLAPKYPFPAQIEDCKSAVRWMRTNSKEYHIDPDRIGGYGYSAGGHLVCLLGATDRADGLEGPDAQPDGPSTRLQCVVAGGAPCEFRMMPADSTRLSYWLGGTRAEKPNLYAMASPRKYVTKDDPPTFLYHGARDALVPVASTEAMADTLRTAGVPVEMYKIPTGGHVSSVIDDTATVKAIEFLDHTLKGEKAVGSRQ